MKSLKTNPFLLKIRENQFLPKVKENQFFQKVKDNPQLQKIIHSKPAGIIATLLCVVFAYTVLYNTKGGYFLSNDDTGMMKTLSGYSTGTPSSYHRFVCTALGVFFKSLYQLNPDVSWYSYVYVGFVLVSISTVFYVTINAIRLKKAWMRAVGAFAAVIFVTAVTLYGIYTIAWTLTSTFFGIAAMELIASLIYPHSKKTTAAICSVSAVFLILSSLIRYSSFLALCPFYLLVVGYIILKNKDKWDIRKHAALALSLLAIIGAASLYNKMDRSYKNTTIETVSRSDFEVYRVRFSDYPVIPYDGNEEFFESIGWDRDFYDVARDWMYMDRRFNTENLRQITEKSRSLRPHLVTTKLDDFALAKLFTAPDRDYQWHIMTCMMLICLLMGISGTVWCLVRKKREYLVDSLMLSGINLLAITECVYIIYQGRYLFRAFMCAATPALCFSTLIFIFMVVRLDKLAFGKNACNMLQKCMACVLAGAALIGILSYGVFGHKVFDLPLKARREMKNSISTDIDRYCVTHKDSLFVHDGIAGGTTQLFLDMSLRGCTQNLLFYGGTGIYSKNYYILIGRYGYSEFYTDNLFDDNVYYMQNSKNIKDTEFMAYMRTAYGDDIKCEEVDHIQDNVYIFKFSR